MQFIQANSGVTIATNVPAVEEVTDLFTDYGWAPLTRTTWQLISDYDHTAIQRPLDEDRLVELAGILDDNGYAFSIDDQRVPVGTIRVLTTPTDVRVVTRANENHPVITQLLQANGWEPSFAGTWVNEEIDELTWTGNPADAAAHVDALRAACTDYGVPVDDVHVASADLANPPTLEQETAAREEADLVRAILAAEDAERRHDRARELAGQPSRNVVEDLARDVREQLDRDAARPADPRLDPLTYTGEEMAVFDAGYLFGHQFTEYQVEMIGYADHEHAVSLLPTAMQLQLTQPTADGLTPREALVPPNPLPAFRAHHAALPEKHREILQAGFDLAVTVRRPDVVRISHRAERERTDPLHQDIAARRAEEAQQVWETSGPKPAPSPAPSPAATPTQAVPTDAAEAARVAAAGFPGPATDAVTAQSATAASPAKTGPAAGRSQSTGYTR